MNDTLHISLAGLAIQKKYEKGPPAISPHGFATKKYIDLAGKATIGWGHVILPNEGWLLTATIDEAQADTLLVADNRCAEQAVKRLVTVELTQNQFDALVTLVFNIGPGKADGIPGDFADSTLLKKLNAGNFPAAADQFLAWNKYRDPSCGCLRPAAGLTARREDERALFLGAFRV